MTLLSGLELIKLKKTMKSKIFIFIAFILNLNFVVAQDGVGINTSGAAPHNSSILEVVSTSKGVLIPSVSTANRPTATGNEGLMIYNTTDGVFNYSNGLVWIALPKQTISKITDTDADTWIDVEKNTNDNLIRFATGQSGSSLEVARIDSVGLDVNYDAASQYMQQGRRLLAMNKTAGSLAVADKAFPSISSVSAANTAIGYRAYFSSASNQANTLLGAYAGENLASSFNTIIGSRAGQLLTTGGSNTLIGYNALKASTTSKLCTVLGNSSAILATNDSLTIVGCNTAKTLTTGRNAIIIGSSLEPSSITANNQLVLGKRITADLSTKNVRFYNLYSFPGTAGSKGDILALNSSLNLDWGGRISRQVAGAMADVKPFDVAMSGSSTSISGIYSMKVTSFASAELAYLSTKIATNTSSTASTIELGLYRKTGAYITKVSTTVAAGQTGEIVLDVIPGVQVESGEIVYVSIYCSSADITFPYMSSSVNPAYTQTGTSLPTTSLTLPGTTDLKSIYVAAY